MDSPLLVSLRCLYKPTTYQCVPLQHSPSIYQLGPSSSTHHQQKPPQKPSDNETPSPVASRYPDTLCSSLTGGVLVPARWSSASYTWRLRTSGRTPSPQHPRNNITTWWSTWSAAACSAFSMCQNHSLTAQSTSALVVSILYYLYWPVYPWARLCWLQISETHRNHILSVAQLETELFRAKFQPVQKLKKMTIACQFLPETTTTRKRKKKKSTFISPKRTENTVSYYRTRWSCSKQNVNMFENGKCLLFFSGKIL